MNSRDYWFMILFLHVCTVNFQNDISCKKPYELTEQNVEKLEKWKAIQEKQR